MQTYRCTCGNRLFFENTKCLACSAEVGWCENCHRLTTLEPDGENQVRCSYADCRQSIRKCHNYAVDNICNRCFNTHALRERAGVRENPEPAAASSDALPAGGVDPADALCRSCQLTDTIPDLAVAGHREKWVRLEAAKRRLLYTLDRLALPYADATPRLSFDFKADVEPPPNDWRNAGEAEIVYTGHANGKITINIREADDAEREQLRVKFHEAHRTLIGHFRHEVGHYYWQLLVQNHRQRERECIQVFGDHNMPPYAEAMAAYYQNGPRPDWAASFISAYASAHPWEDFAETFALYLDVVEVLDTATHLYKSVSARLRGPSVAPLVAQFLEIGVLGNEFNRAMGLIDLTPKIVAPPVVAKLEFIHKLVKNAATKRNSKKSPALAPTSAVPVLTLAQQGIHSLEPAIIVGETPSPSGRGLG
jgi:hypothetical protein